MAFFKLGQIATAGGAAAFAFSLPTTHHSKFQSIQQQTIATKTTMDTLSSPLHVSLQHHNTISCLNMHTNLQSPIYDNDSSTENGSSDKLDKISNAFPHEPIVVTPNEGEEEEDISKSSSSSPSSSSSSNSNFLKLCSLLSVTPPDMLRLHTCPDGVRGVYLNQSVKKGDIILSIPFESCLQDDEPPDWYVKEQEQESAEDCSDPYEMNDWSTRLAASLLDLQLNSIDDDDSMTDSSDIDKGKSLWLSMLPDANFLSASLPIHWDEDIVASAQSTALELSVDSTYFARAVAIQELLDGLHTCDFASTLTDEELRAACHNALDLVQTRSCRPERQDGTQWGPPVRLLAPVFDFINHGGSPSSSSASYTDGTANAYFELAGDDITDMVEKGPFLVVRAAYDINANEEVLIDYGASARPAWKCLASYGFVPEYRTNEEGSDDDDVAELFMDGVRYDVGPSTVPFELVQAVSASLGTPEETIIRDWRALDAMLDSSYHNRPLLDEEEEKYEKLLQQVQQQTQEMAENMLTPAVALHIAKRVSDVGFQLLLKPDNGADDVDRTPEELYSDRLAASLRWAQHRILLNCAVGLRDYATRNN